jgi:hypothetical protein
MTWHQWQVEYPMERKTGLSSSAAFLKASSPHGYQSTGLYACCCRYGLFSLMRWLGGFWFTAGLNDTEGLLEDISAAMHDNLMSFVQEHQVHHDYEGALTIFFGAKEESGL